MKSNFSVAFFLLPKHKREALKVLYAYCRHVDDIVDETLDPIEAQRQIDAWKKHLDRLHHLTPSDPQLAHDLYKLVSTYFVRVEDLFWILKGVEMDLYKKRYETISELLDYCDAVASAVGLAMMPILGADRDDCYAYAMTTGRALQLTNILRDVSSDLKRGRIYLPKEDLVRFGYYEQSLELQIYNDAFVALMSFEVNRALGYYFQAEQLIPEKDLKNLAAAEAMRSIYLYLLKRIHFEEYRVFRKKIKIQFSSKAEVFTSHMMAMLFPKAD